MFEINLVPDVKNEMIKAQKLRNLVLYICIVVSIVAIAIVLILLSIKGGQDVTMTIQDKRMDKMSKKLDEFDNLNEFLTIQDQLGNLSSIAENQKAASRVFSILSTILPASTSADTLTLSELNIDLENSILSMEAQANAGEEPLIDYRVLESFKKTIALTTYDYGDYVDKNGNIIPSMCITEVGEDGNVLVEDGSYYAIWYKGVKGCDPENPEYGDNKVEERNIEEDTIIYRTPKFNDWTRRKYMKEDGTISGIEHFESQCIKYTGNKVGDETRWNQEENTCLLAADGFDVTESSNGRDEENSLVLRFAGSLTVDPAVFSARNNFVTIIGPYGQNVTDSYIQVEGMFAKKASDCKAGDTTCKTTDDAGGDK